MRVVTIASDIEQPFLNKLLIPSCHTAGLALTVLHADRNDFDPADKRAILTDYLRKSIAPDDLFLFTDAYDTVLVRGEEFIRERYASFSQGIVFSAEPNSYPLGPLGLALHDAPPERPYPYLNSGGFIATAGQFLDLCAKYPTPPSDQFPLLRRLREHGYDIDQRFGFSDQYHWTLVQHLEPRMVRLDHKAAIFESFAPVLPDVRDAAVRAEWRDFRLRGKEADGYHRERARLVPRLRQPSGAAQLHFSSPITKAVTLDLFDEAALPSWLQAALGSRQTHYPDVEVRRV
ncbi:glycosyltransferase domain-containing protein [Micromonosporaceae bacterium B7E4]